MNEKVFIIIVTYNGMEWLPKCLKSTTPYPVIVVDNGSSDNTVPFIEECHPEIILLKQKKNLGFGQANNMGISHALQKEADYVFLLNQDAYLKLNAIEELVEVQRQNRHFGILSPIHLNGNGEKLDENFSHYLHQDINKNFYSDYVLNKTKKEIYEVPFVNAAGWLISRNCLEIVGGFDPIFFHYGEDDNYCQRLKYHGIKIGVVPKTFILHDREFRENNIMSNGDSESFSRIARASKIRFGNINEENTHELSKLIKKRKLARMKSILKLNIAAYKIYSDELKIFKEVYQSVQCSRRINQVEGAHYLKL